MTSIILPLALLIACIPAAADSMVTNGDFEKGLDGWTLRVSERMGQVRLDDDGAGGECVRLHKTVATPQWSCVAVTQQMPVQPNSQYMVTFRYRAALKQGVVGHACRVFVSGNGIDDHRAMSPASEWSEFEWQFSTGAVTESIRLQIALTYSSGDLWVDDVVVRKVGGSIEAEAFPEKTRATVRTSRQFSANGGVELAPGGSISMPLELDCGVWRVEVFGEGADTDDGLTRRAITVQLDGPSQTVDLHRQGTKYHGRVAYLRTDNPGTYELKVRRADGFNGPVIVDRISWVAYRGPYQARPLCRETPIVANGKAEAVIVAGHNTAIQRAARDLQAAIRQKTGVTLLIVDDTQWMSGDYRSEHAIAVGNLLQNKLAERLYCLWYTFEDCWYPGPGGWVVRTVHDPWGREKNVIVLAGSDDASATEAVQEFVRLIGSGENVSLGHTIKVKMATEVEEGVRRACGIPDPDYARRRLDRSNQRSLMSNAARVGMSYARSGDPARARMMLVYLLEHKRRPEFGHDTHMELWKTIRAWDNVEECPAITDDERLEITNYLLRVLRSGEGVFNSMFVGSLGRSVVRHNHHMLAAMDAYYGGHYFKKYHDLPDADQWLEMARFCFASQELHEKGQDESGNYEMSTALRPLLPYAYTEPGYQFLPSGTAGKFLDRCCMAIDNRFSLSGHGDCWDVNCFAPLSLAVGAWYYRDGAYQYILEERFRVRPGERNAMQIQPPFRMDGVVKPERPARFEGVAIAPLSVGHDQLYRGTGDLQWNVPREQAFDKISFRSRFEPNAQYLLLDGIACGSHGHRDANCLIRFTDNDRVWLVDDSYTEGPFLSDHNGVLVTRDGIAEPMPALARLDTAIDFGDVAITRTTLPDHSGLDWERNVLWIKEKCFIILDRMRARKRGNYGLQCKWRTLGRADIDGHRLVTRQQRVNPDRRDAMHIVFAEDVRPRVVEDRDTFGARWRGQYEYAEPVVNIHSQNVERSLDAGDSFTFANLFYATNADEPHHFDIAKVNADQVLVSGETRMVVGTADDGCRIGGISLQAGPFLVDRQTLTTASATSLDVDGIQILSSETPVGLSLDLNHHKLVLHANAPTRVIVLGASRPLAKGKTTVDVDRLDRSSFEKELDEAEQKSGSQQYAGERMIARGTNNVKVVSSFDAGAAIHAIASDGRNILVGTEDGTGVLVDEHGKPIWRMKAEGRINAVSVGDLNGDGREEYLLASEDAHVYAVASTGELLWRFRCPSYPKRSSKLGQVRDVMAADLDGDGKSEVIAGANNIRLHVLDGRGNEIRSFEGYDPHMTFSNFSAVDLDGDGKCTILAFPSSGSFGYGMRFELDGRSDNFSTDGWPSHIRDRAELDLNGDGKPDFACGTNRGNIYFLTQGRDDLRIQKVFAFGNPVTSMAGFTRAKRIGLVAVGIEASYVHLLDGDGRLLWSRPTGGPVTDIEFVPTDGDAVVAAATAEGSLLFFNEAGDLLGQWAGPSPILRIATLGQSVIVGDDQGRLSRITLSPAIRSGDNGCR